MNAQDNIPADDDGHVRTDSAEPLLSFYDHHRQRYAHKVPIPHAGEFLIGAYNGDGTVGPDGEFRVALIDITYGPRWGLYPRLMAFGDGTAALRRAIDAGLLDALERGPVETRDEFAHRLLHLGFVDLSDRPLPMVALLPGDKG